MKEKIDFENLSDLHKGLPPDKRPADILLKGESIFSQEKTPAQKECIKTAWNLVAERLDKLGVKHKDFDPERIVFLPQKSTLSIGEYHDGDFLSVEEAAEGNLSAIIHELTHAQSAEWRNYPEVELEEFLGPNSRRAKSGFHRNLTFKTINEGITEKITQEIIKANPEELTKLKPLFSGRRDEMLAAQEKKFIEEILPIRVREKEEKLVARKKNVEEIEARHRQTIASLENDIAQAETKEEKEYLLEIKKEEESWHDLVIKNARDTEMIIDPVKLATEINDAKLTGIMDNYSFEAGRLETYDFNVEAVSKIIEGIARYNVKNNRATNLDKERQIVWDNLQRAYFSGLSVHLRKVDEVFGPGFLRFLDKFNTFTEESVWRIFLKTMEEKIEQL